MIYNLASDVTQAQHGLGAHERGGPGRASQGASRAPSVPQITALSHQTTFPPIINIILICFTLKTRTVDFP